MSQSKSKITSIATYGVDWFYILLLFIYAGFLFFIPFTANILLFLCVMVALYVLTLVYLNSVVTKFYILDEGIQVIKEGKTNYWTWFDITSISGIRHHHSLYGVLPIIKYGANHFYGGNDELFSVSVLNSGANHLVKYIQIKMFARSTHEQIESLIREDSVIQLGNIRIDKNGIGNRRSFYSWQEIENIIATDNDTDNLDISIIHKDNHKHIRLGKPSWHQGLTILALAEHFTNREYLDTLALDTINTRKRIIRRARGMALVLLISIGVSAIFVIGLLFYNYFQ